MSNAQPPADLFFFAKVVRVGATALVRARLPRPFELKQGSLSLVPNEERISTKSSLGTIGWDSPPNVAEWAECTIRCRVLVLWENNRAAFAVG